MRAADVEAVRYAMSLLPERWQQFFDSNRGCHFFFGDSIFAGLTTDEYSDDGRSYRTTGHVCWPVHQPHISKDRRTPTIVLPPEDPYNTVTNVIVHEMGHVVHHELDFRSLKRCEPVSEYGATNVWEHFAEIFTQYVVPWPYKNDVLTRDDHRFLDHLFL